MRPLRVAHLVSHPIPYFAPLYRELAERPEIDLTVHFYSDEGATAFHDREFAREVAWDARLLDGYEYRFARDASRVPAAPSSTRISADVVRAVAGGRYDIVWAHGTAHATTWAALAAARLRGARLLVRDEQTLLHPRAFARRAGREVALRALFSQASGLYIGEQNRRHFLRYGMPAGRLYPARYCVDNRWFRVRASELAPRRAELRAAFGITDDGAAVLFVGKLVDKKQPLRLIEAFARVHRLHEAWLLIVGDGPLRAAAERLAAQLGIATRVRFTGFLNHSEIPPAYAAADVFVLPSALHETWGLVVNEAMNFALPVVVTDMVGCAEDLVRPGWNGDVIPYDDTAALSRAIARLTADRALRLAYGARSASLVDRYSIESAADGIVSACIAAPARASTEREAVVTWP